MVLQYKTPSRSGTRFRSPHRERLIRVPLSISCRVSTDLVHCRAYSQYSLLRTSLPHYRHSLLSSSSWNTSLTHLRPRHREEWVRCVSHAKSLSFGQCRFCRQREDSNRAPVAIRHPSKQEPHRQAILCLVRRRWLAAYLSRCGGSWLDSQRRYRRTSRAVASYLRLLSVPECCWEPARRPPP